MERSDIDSSGVLSPTGDRREAVSKQSEI
jgi:hypothetical protein